MYDSPEFRAVQLHQAERAVIENPGLTSAQLAEATGADRDTLLNRLQELQRAGRVYAGELRGVCPITGRPASVWRPGRDPDVRHALVRPCEEPAPPADPLSAADVAA